MESLPRPAVVTAAWVLLALAVLGAYQGWSRSALDESGAATAGVLSPTVAPVAGAKNATPLSDSALMLSEQQIREIARQEARAVVRGDPSPASTGPSGGGSAAGQPPIGAARPVPVPSLAPERIAPERPSAASPEPPAESQAPLF